MNDPKWVEGQFGKALEFDGQDDYVNAGDAEILKPTADVTFVAWLYWIGGNYVLASGGQTSSTGYAITHNLVVARFSKLKKEEKVGSDGKKKKKERDKNEKKSFHNMLASIIL